ncbi:D-alanyl-D-alanine carboxypeptidase/D-alanyl-D-alanine endopeptidase, partial [Nodularia spumigena]|uniref:D-alanyl-D-alanine carboxypeptidase/D-alanyl-D-alanine endopeptidase n=1 Tax=Nodularia spumigena TaxID=70799 RepID=UPI002B2007CC
VVDTGKTRLSVKRMFGTNEIVLVGEILRGTNSFTRSPSIYNPGVFYVTVLREHLIQNRLTVTGNAFVFSDSLIAQELAPKTTLLHTHYSPLGIEILKELMKRSQNLYAETMTRKMALNRHNQASFEKGAEILAEHLETMGIKKDTYQYYDGSGLSRYNYFSPNQFVKILEYMYTSKYKYQWLETMPIAGVDGTLRSRMRNSTIKGKVFAKTGTISNARGLSGYVTAQNGEVYVFSFLVNAHLNNTSETDRITDTVLEFIAQFK